MHIADKFTDNQLFNFISGSAITGESTYDIWKSLGNEGTVSDFIEYMRTGPQGIQGPQGETGPQPALIDNLTSTSTIEALTANQGKILNDKFLKKGYIPFYPTFSNKAVYGTYRAFIPISNIGDYSVELSDIQISNGNSWDDVTSSSSIEVTDSGILVTCADSAAAGSPSLIGITFS